MDHILGNGVPTGGIEDVLQRSDPCIHGDQPDRTIGFLSNFCRYRSQPVANHASFSFRAHQDHGILIFTAEADNLLSGKANADLIANVISGKLVRLCQEFQGPGFQFLHPHLLELGHGVIKKRGLDIQVWLEGIEEMDSMSCLMSQLHSIAGRVFGSG